jgi:hypothetical protein
LNINEGVLGPPTGAPVARDLEALRKVDDELGSQISRLSLLRLGLMIIVMFLFAGGIWRQDDEPIRNTIDKIESIEQERSLPSAALDPITLYLIDPSFNDEDIEKLLVQLKQQYSNAFKVKYSFLGTELVFDLRILIVSFPLWLPVAHVYIQILKQKRRVIHIIGAALMQRAAADQVTPVDRLMFGGAVTSAQPYRLYPGFLIDFFFCLTFVMLAVMVAVTLLRSANTFDPSHYWALLVLANFVFASAFYSRAYSEHAVSLLRAQAEALFQCEVPPDRLVRIWRRARELPVLLAKRVPARISLSTSGVLILLTLVLNTGEVGCKSHVEVRRLDRAQAAGQPSPSSASVPLGDKGRYRPGYELLTGDAAWPLSLDPLFRWKLSWEDTFGRAIYALILLLALFSLVLSIAPGIVRDRYARRGARFFARLCVVICIILVGEFADQTFLFSGSWTFPVAAATLAWLIFGRRASQSARWDGICNFLVVMFVPLLFADFIFMGSKALHLPGLVILYFAVILMTLGHVGMADSLPLDTVETGPAVERGTATGQ